MPIHLVMPTPDGQLEQHMNYAPFFETYAVPGIKPRTEILVGTPGLYASPERTEWFRNRFTDQTAPVRVYVRRQGGANGMSHDMHVVDSTDLLPGNYLRFKDLPGVVVGRT